MNQKDPTTISGENEIFPPKGLTRRSLLHLGSLTLLASALMSLWPITRYLSSQPDTGPSTLKYKDESHTKNQWIPLPNSRVWLLHDQGGYTALLATCTHLGCEVKLHSDNLWHCPCHGSIYDWEGRPLSGPAPRPLPRLAITLQQDGSLLIDLKKTVGLDVRVS